MTPPTTPAPKQSNYHKTSLRLPPALHAELHEAAVRNGRSVNAEIIDRLQGSPTGTTLNDIARQNLKTHALVQVIIDAISARR